MHAVNGNIKKKHIKSQIHRFERLLEDVLNRALLYQKRRINFDNLYQSVSTKIHSGPGYRKRKCSEMKRIYKRFDKKLKDITFLSEKYRIEMSPLKMEKLFPRLRLLELEFLERFSELCNLRQACKRFCHKCPKNTQTKTEDIIIENCCFSNSGPIIGVCCYSVESSHPSFDDYLEYTMKPEYSMSEAYGVSCIQNTVCIASHCYSMDSVDDEKVKSQELFVKSLMKSHSAKVIRGKWKKRFLRRQLDKSILRLQTDVLTYENAHFLFSIMILFYLVGQNLKVNPQHFSKYERNVWLEILYGEFDLNNVVVCRHSPTKSRKKRNKEMHIINGNTDRIENPRCEYKYHYLQHRHSDVNHKDLVEKQDPLRLDCLKHAINNMFYVRNNFTNVDLNLTVDKILQEFELVSKDSNVEIRTRFVKWKLQCKCWS